MFIQFHSISNTWESYETVWQAWIFAFMQFKSPEQKLQTINYFHSSPEKTIWRSSSIMFPTEQSSSEVSTLPKTSTLSHASNRNTDKREALTSGTDNTEEWLYSRRTGRERMNTLERCSLYFAAVSSARAYIVETTHPNSEHKLWLFVSIFASVSASLFSVRSSSFTDVLCQWFAAALPKKNFILIWSTFTDYLQNRTGYFSHGTKKYPIIVKKDSYERLRLATRVLLMVLYRYSTAYSQIFRSVSGLTKNYLVRFSLRVLHNKSHQFTSESTLDFSFVGDQYTIPRPRWTRALQPDKRFRDTGCQS